MANLVAFSTLKKGDTFHLTQDGDRYEKASSCTANNIGNLVCDYSICINPNKLVLSENHTEIIMKLIGGNSGS